MGSTEILLGSYTNTTHLARFTAPSAESPAALEVLKELAIPRASWITRHPSLADIFYIAHEADDDGGRIDNVEGKLWVYRISREGEAEKLGEVSAKENPCHVVVVGDGRGLAAANVGTAYLARLMTSLQPDRHSLFHSTRTAPLCRAPRTTISSCHRDPTTPSPNVISASMYPPPSSVGSSTRERRASARWTSLTVQMGALPGSSMVKKMCWRETGRGRQSCPLTVSLCTEGACTDTTGRHLYTLHARSCLVTHHDLAKTQDERLVSTHDILPPAYSIDMNNRTPPFTFAAALNLHAPSSTLIATSRFLKGADVDSVAFLKLDSEDRVSANTILRPQRGREYRGVGIVGDCYLVAGQHDGWLSCFEWIQTSDEWKEREFATPVNIEKVVDIESF